MDKYTLLKQELSIPQEAKIHGITWRWVDKQKKKKYPAFVYEIQGKTKTKHIPKRLYHLLDTLDTKTNLDTGLDTQLDTNVSNKLDTLPETEDHLTKLLRIKEELKNWVDRYIKNDDLYLRNALNEIFEKQKDYDKRKRYFNVILELLVVMLISGKIDPWFYIRKKEHLDKVLRQNKIPPLPEYPDLFSDFLTMLDILNKFVEAQEVGVREKVLFLNKTLEALAKADKERLERERIEKGAFFKFVEGMTKHLNFDDKIELLKIALEAILEKDQLSWEEINRTKAMIKIFWSILKDQAKNLHKKESIK